MQQVTRALVVGAVLFSATGGPAQVGAQTRLPQLKQAFASKSIESSPQAAFFPIAVGPQGNVLITADKGSDFRLLLLDSNGAVLARMGRSGAGPGEARNPFPLYVGAKTVAAWDAGLLRLTEWGTDGKLERSTTPKTPMAVSTRFGDRYIGFILSSAGAKPTLLDPATGTTADLLPAADSFYRAEFKPLSPTTPFAAAPIVGEWKDGFLIASTASYRFGLYGRDGQLKRVLGRELKPVLPSPARVERQMAMFRSMKMPGRQRTEADFAKARKLAEETPVPSFALGTPLHADSTGRLWVLGIQGDSAFADVFTSERFLGRIGIACHGFEGKWSLSGRWLAMVCAPDDPDFEGDAILKLFQITEAGRR